MPAWSDIEVLEVWEAGLRRHPLERARVLLGHAEPGVPPSRLARMPLGRVNRRLLELHARLFDPRLEGTANCPQCGARVEFEVDTRRLVAESEATADDSIVIEHAEGSVSARLPTLEDLEAATRCEDLEEARRMIVSRCVLEASGPDRTAVSPDVLPAGLTERLAAEFASADPAAEIALRLECPACGRAWCPVLEPAEFLWNRLAAEARRLLLDVHVLARAYGWSESEILGMGPARRQAYLEMVGAA